MSLDRTCPRRVVPCGVVFVLAAVSLCAGGPRALAQEAAPSSTASDATPAGEPAQAKPEKAKPEKTKSDKTKSDKTKPHRGARKASAKSAESPTMQAQDAPASAPRTSGAQMSDAERSDAKSDKTKPPPAIDFMAPLGQAGVSACRNEVNTLATSTMGQVEKFNTVSNWSQVGGNKRAVSLSIGQKYADGSAVPFGLSQIISAPNAQSSCDSFLVQVLPSPLSCAKLRESIIAQQGTQIGDLAGVALMQNGPARTMLVPTSAGTCVLVSTRTVYGK